MQLTSGPIVAGFFSRDLESVLHSRLLTSGFLRLDNSNDQLFRLHLDACNVGSDEALIVNWL
jgi:hypothetical protein